MTLQLTFVGAPERLPSGKWLRVEIRDTSYADAPAVLVKRVETTIPASGREKDPTVTVDLDAVPDGGATVWAHVDADGDGRVSKGDFVTVESYPVGVAPLQRTAIRLKKVF